MLFYNQLFHFVNQNRQHKMENKLARKKYFYLLTFDFNLGIPLMIFFSFQKFYFNSCFFL